MPLTIFPSLPFQGGTVDPDFQAEVQAASFAGLRTAFFDHERLLQGDVRLATALIPSISDSAVLRGWMLTPDQYGALYSAVLAKGLTLLNDPSSYRFVHYLPEAYPTLEGSTPRSVWLPMTSTPDFDAIFAAINALGARAVVIKDYVKSQKHYWSEACFIPDANERALVQRVVSRFLELQGGSLNEGLVIREYLPLKIVGSHPKSGLPLAAEVRIFWLDREPVVVHRYWDELTAFDADVPLNRFGDIAARVPARFFTMDVALREDGDWIIIELGDAQVADIPSPKLAPGLFTKLRTAMERTAG